MLSLTKGVIAGMAFFVMVPAQSQTDDSAAEIPALVTYLLESDTDTPPDPDPDPSGECGDGIDNDGDGLVDWGQDLGCTALNDNSEGGRPTGAIENSFTVHEPAASTTITFVANNGSDTNECGAGASGPKRTLANAVTCIRDGEPDWLLLRAGDDFGTQLDLGSLSGASSSQPILIGAYYPSNNHRLTRPRVDGLRMRGSNIHLLGLDLGNRRFDFQDDRSQSNILLEGNLQTNVPLGGGSALTVQGTNIAIRHHVFDKSAGSPIYARWTDHAVYEHILFKNPAYGDSNHAIYETKGTNEPGNARIANNWVYMGADASAGISAKTHGNGLMIRPGANLIERNVLDSVPWADVSVGACNDNGGSGTCGDGTCGTCAPFTEVRSTFLSNCSSRPDPGVWINFRYAPSGSIDNTCYHSCSRGFQNRPSTTEGSIASEPATESAVGLLDYHESIGGDGTVSGWWTDLQNAKRWRNTPTEYLANAFFEYVEANSGCTF